MDKLDVGGLYKLIVTRGIDVVGMVHHSTDGRMEIAGAVNCITFHPSDIRTLDGRSIRLYPEYWRKHDVVGDYGMDNTSIHTRGIV